MAHALSPQTFFKCFITNPYPGGYHQVAVEARRSPLSLLGWCDLADVIGLM